MSRPAGEVLVDTEVRNRKGLVCALVEETTRVRVISYLLESDLAARESFYQAIFDAFALWPVWPAPEGEGRVLAVGPDGHRPVMLLSLSATR